MFLCTKCGKEGQEKDFSPRLNRVKPVSSWCKQCQTNEAKKRYRDANPEAIKSQKLLNAFGIDILEYNKLLEAQDGVCAICNKKESVVGNNNKLKSLAVDHCHTTGRIRGLLCQKCNQALGLFEDSIENLISATNYLKEGI